MKEDVFFLLLNFARQPFLSYFLSSNPQRSNSSVIFNGLVFCDLHMAWASYSFIHFHELIHWSAKSELDWINHYFSIPNIIINMKIWNSNRNMNVWWNVTCRQWGQLFLTNEVNIFNFMFFLLLFFIYQKSWYDGLFHSVLHSHLSSFAWSSTHLSTRRILQLAHQQLSIFRKHPSEAYIWQLGNHAGSTGVFLCQKSFIRRWSSSAVSLKLKKKFSTIL